MGLLEDVLRALERIPAWKRVHGMPAEVEALRARVEALERRLDPATGDACPRCKAPTFRLMRTIPEPSPFGALGALQDQFECSSCNYETVRNRDPG
jgi:hypothetical protein